MLFSDIEGSTALLSRLGDRYAGALSAQRALMRAAFSAAGGRELGTEGDSFFVVFESAGDAVGCCVAGQRALSGHDWPGGVAVRVRPSRPTVSVTLGIVPLASSRCRTTATVGGLTWATLAMSRLLSRARVW